VTKITGTVRAVDGSPIEGVLVMDAHLNYSQTDSNGTFRIAHPEMALFFWCTGFLPRVRVLTTGDLDVETVLERAATSRVSA